jgi:hypothetical protein
MSGKAFAVGAIPAIQPYCMNLPSCPSMEVFNSSQKLNDLVVSGLV